MTKEEFIKLYKKDGTILIQHSERVGLDGTALMQYVPHGTISTMLGHGWYIVADVPTPPEALEVPFSRIIENFEETEIKKPAKRGRKPKES